MKPTLYTSTSFLTTFLTFFIFILAGCAGAPVEPTPTAAPPVKVVISGSGGTSAILKPLAEAFHQKHSNWDFEFLSGAGSSGGIKGALDGTLDLGALARPPKDEEVAQGIQYLHFATDRVAFVTSPDISVGTLTGQQVKDIFAGKITNWSDVGGPDGSINVLVRDEDETNTQILRKALFADVPFSTAAPVFTSEGDLRKALTNSSRAITFVSYGGIKLENVQVNTLIVDGQDPTNFSNNDYPYTRPAGVAYIMPSAAKLQPFLDFLTSEEAKKLLAEQGSPAPAQ